MDGQSVTLVKDFFMQNPAAIVGLILPPLIDIFGKDIDRESETQKFLVSFGVCLGVAALFNFNKIVINSWADVFTSFGIIFTESQIVYKLYFKKSYIRSKILQRVYDGKTEEEEENPSPKTDTSQAVG